MKTRIVSAIVLLPLLLAILLVAPKIWTVVLVGILAVVAVWELLWKSGLVRQLRPVIYSMVMALFVSCYSCFSWSATSLKIAVFIYFVLLFAETMLQQMKLGFDKIAICFVSGMLLPFLISSLARIQMYDNNRFCIMIPFIIAFLSDTGAYFVGCAIGKHKLAPKISPKKTVEGVVGGVLSAVLTMMLYGLVLDRSFALQVNYLYFAIYGVVGSIGSVFGDLCFSVIKRQAGIKDYGNIIPGHGGVLDRFDSIMVVAPLVEILLILLPLAV